MNRGGSMASSNCTPHARSLWADDATQGWGNRIGWWLTCAAVAEALGTRVHSSVRGGGPSGGGRNYRFDAVLRCASPLTPPVGLGLGLGLKLGIR